jgi:DNA ligase (NAD+)
MRNKGCEKMDELRSLIDWLNARTIEYDKGSPTVTDKEWDEKYFELKKKEEETGIYYPDSPTQSLTTDFEVVSELKKVEHSHPMLSLNKTKDMDELKNFIRSTKESCIMMQKMDGLTVSLEYKDSYLIKAETRGNGYVGEDVLHNVKTIRNIPTKIPYIDPLIVDGEVISTYKDFEPFSDMYSNTRNFAAGSLRLLDSRECAKRNLTFVAWDVPSSAYDNLADNLQFLSDLGFTTVNWHLILPNNWTDDWIESSVSYLKKESQIHSYPIDGFVVKINDKKRYAEVGTTAHHPKGALALKEYDEEVETELTDIEYTMGKSGVLTPVGIFRPVNILDAVVSRANLHNLSVMENTLGKPYRGQKITVFRANMVIPQISGGEIPLEQVDFFEVPKTCPYCGSPTQIITDNIKSVLTCTNEKCGGRINNIIEHYCSKKGLDIKGFGERTINFLLGKGWITDISDLYTLEQYKDEWVKCDGWGVTSVNNLLFNILNSRECELPNFIAAIGIPDIGITIAKKICEHVSTYEEFRNLINSNYDFTQWYGFSYETQKKLVNFDYSIADRIYNNYLTISEYKKEEIQESPLNGAKIVITGKLSKFKSRTLAKDYFTKLGCSVTDTVTKSTTFLLNNDKNSTTAKNKKAQDLGIPIYTEEEVYEKYNLT